MDKITPRHKRIKDFRRIALQTRDIEIILAVYENRFLRRDQIERLFFNSLSVCNTRLQSLYQHKFLDRIYQPVDFGSSKATYAIDKNGAGVVANRLGVSTNQIIWTRRHNSIENIFLAHTLAVSEVHVSLICALRNYEDITLMFWKREGLLPREKVMDPDNCENKITLIPDAFFGLQTPQGKLMFFVEVDMATETLKRFRRKIIAYREYWKSKQYQDRYTYRNFRVLTVTTGPTRLNNLVELAGNVGAKNMFLFSVHDLVSSAPLGYSWYRPNSLDSVSLLD